jgi:hypothetical protein
MKIIQNMIVEYQGKACEVMSGSCEDVCQACSFDNKDCDIDDCIQSIGSSSYLKIVEKEKSSADLHPDLFGGEE